MRIKDCLVVVKSTVPVGTNDKVEQFINFLALKISYINDIANLCELVGKDNFNKKYPEGKFGQGTIKYVDNIEKALKEANVCFIFTEWEEIKEVKPEEYKKLMKTPLVYDGRNIYDIKEMNKALVEYYSIGKAFR